MEHTTSQDTSKLSSNTPGSSKVGSNGCWKTRWTFILAATGSAVGLGNLWKFPYIVGENGGGAFILVYLVCIILIGVPILLAETLIGRTARLSPINAMASLATESGASKHWSLVGVLGVITGIVILSFYAVVAGWALHYFFLSAFGELANISADDSNAIFGALLASPLTLILWQTLFLFLSLIIVSLGVTLGIGLAVRYLMPLLFLLLIVLGIYSAVIGNLNETLRFLFEINVDALSWKSALVAMGHAFFTLSLGMGAMMAYGAYLPSQENGHTISLGSTVLVIAVFDTLVAILAGVVIFPIVFSHAELAASQGPGLLFVTLPLALTDLSLGPLFAALFFLLVTIAALSSAISLLEPAVSWLVETKSYSRVLICSVLGGLVWLLGLGTVFSFNHWQDITLFGRTFFDTLDYLSSHLLLPLGGLLIALFVGWVMKKTLVFETLGSRNNRLYQAWYVLVKYLSPLLLLIVFVCNFFMD